MHAISSEPECQATADFSRSSVPAPLIAMLQFCRSRCCLWYNRARERRSLSKLDAHLLRDIGVNRLDAAREAAKPFWKA